MNRKGRGVTEHRMRSTWEIIPFDALCALEKFIINGKEADMGDFVDKYDHCRSNAPEYGCGDMRCDVLPATEDVLHKYNITLNEYNEIAEEIEGAVSFGRCGWCV